MTETWLQILTIVGSTLVIMLTFFSVTISLHKGMQAEISELKNCVKDHHARVKVLEHELEI